MSEKKCPRCGLWNNESAAKCDCGYMFVASPQLTSSSDTGVMALQAIGKPFSTRAICYLVDSLIVIIANFVIQFVVGIAIGLVYAMLGWEFRTKESSFTQGVSFIIGLVNLVFYFALFEWLYGATPGKFLFGMIVITDTGGPCGIGAAVIRGVLRYIDGLFFGIPAYASMKAPLQQRIGDKAANTIVVSRKDPIIQQRRAWWRFAIASGLYSLVYSVIAVFLYLITML